MCRDANVSAIVLVFLCEWAKTIRIRYVWTRYFSKTDGKNICVLKNMRIRVDRARKHQAVSLLVTLRLTVWFRLVQSELA